MSCPGGIYSLHPLWEAYLQELLRIEQEPTIWDKLQVELGEGPEKPTVPKWVPCPGKNCGHEEDLLVTLGA